MKTRKIIISAFAMFIIIYAFNSCRIVDRADKAYDNLEYSKAIPRYKKALKKDSTDSRSWARLGECYKMNNLTSEAEQCFAKALANPTTDNIYKLYYAQMLINNNKYDEAQKWIEAYKTTNPDDSRGAAIESGINHLDMLRTDASKYKVEKLSVNSEEAEFSPAFYKDGIVFTSSRHGADWAERADSWTGESYYSLYYSKGKDLDFQSPELFEKSIQSKYNNSTVCFNGDATEMIITRNNIENGKVKISDDRVVKLKLYTLNKKNDAWSEIIPFQYNSDDYSCAHPALSTDGKRLYFSSDMPGTLGGMDLWVCSRTETGWSTPVNMGRQINTPGNEVFPTVDNDGTIYFSSNGRDGLGGLDIFSTSDSAGIYSHSVNKGAPVNSSDDDFGLIWNTSRETGYLSSNRFHQGMNDDIFSVVKNINNITFEGVVMNDITKTLLDSARIMLVNLTRRDTVKTVSNHEGYYSFKNVPAECKYKLLLESNYCIGKSVDTSTVGIAGTNTIRIDMSLYCLSENIVLNNIYYDLDKYNIRKDASIELDKLVQLMKLYPQVQIELGSHTDSRATFTYNMVLSKNRANSAVQYLVEQGIDKRRMVSEGYGESRLINRCVGEGRIKVECSEAEHQLNRRTEIKILSWNWTASK